MSVYIIDKCERFVSQRAGCGKAASPDSVRGVRPQGVRLLDPMFLIIEEYIHDVNVQILLERYAHFEIIGISILQLQFPKENKHIPCCIFSLALYI